MAGIRPGDVIAGKFRVERALGEGGMGYVVAARHLQLGQIVALKFMREEIVTPDYKSRFLREARNTVRLKSKHVARVLDVGTLEPDARDGRGDGRGDGKGVPYMVMEYLEGTDLSELLHKSGPIPVHEACEYVLQACQALAEAHGHGIIHRDLKPANLFLTRGQSGEPIVKVLDFGVSKALDPLGMEEETNPGGRPRSDSSRVDSVVTKVSDLLGSPSYMAPEQVISARDADVRSDVWSLGVILFRLISGKAPFHGSSLGELIQGIMHSQIPSLRDVKPDLPPGLEHIVAHCIERDRSQRLGDVVELARLLAPYAGPVATPSLERIAVLGPALVSVPPPPAPSYHSSSQSSGSRANAWTTPPASALAAPDKKDFSPGLAAILGAVFVICLAVTAVIVARFTAAKPATKTVVPSPPAALVETKPSSSTTSVATAAPTDSTPTFVPASLPAAASVKPPHRPAHAPSKHEPQPGPAGQDIPATRE